MLMQATPCVALQRGPSHLVDLFVQQGKSTNIYISGEYTQDKILGIVNRFDSGVIKRDVVPAVTVH